MGIETQEIANDLLMATELETDGKKSFVSNGAFAVLPRMASNPRL